MEYNDRVIDILKSVSAIIADDHFVGTSGRHFATYVNKDRLYPRTDLTAEVCSFFAEAHADLPIDVVAGPAMGGIILSQWTAHELSKLKHQQIPSVYAEKKEGMLQFTRGYDDLIKGKNVLIVEDLTTTGGSLRTVIDLVRQANGNPIACAVMLNRDPQRVTEDTFGVPFAALAELFVPSYTAQECPLCKNGTPVNTTIGHGKNLSQTA